MPTRRDALLLGPALLCGCGATSQHRTKRLSGCFARAIGEHFSASNIAIRSSSGRTQFDVVLAMANQQLIKLFNVRPAFSYFEEPQEIGPNALATSERLLDPSSDGTILFGLRLVEKVTWDPDGRINVAAPSDLRTVLAHEYAHIFQLRLNGVFSMPVPWRELQADFLAAWYCARALDDDRFLIFPGAALYKQGDLDFANPQHHGTHSQRLVMGLEGARYARESPSATALDAANFASRLLIHRPPRVLVQATRQWFDGSKNTIIGDD